MKKQAGYSVIELVWAVFLLVGLVAAGGWVANIVKLVGMDLGNITGMLIVRAAGIFVPPLGAILGFF
jgi:hypothetical protein